MAGSKSDLEHRSDSKVCVLNHWATVLSSHIKILLSFSLIHILLTFPGYINQGYPEKQIYIYMRRFSLPDHGIDSCDYGGQKVQ